MKLPREVDARLLIKALGRLGYAVTRQTGSHIRLTCAEPSPHSVTVPNHALLKTGTLHAILADVAAHQRIDKSALLEKLFSSHARTELDRQERGGSARRRSVIPPAAPHAGGSTMWMSAKRRMADTGPA